MGSFCRLPGTSGCFPCPLSALEEHNFLFQLRGGEQPPPEAKEVCVPGDRAGCTGGRPDKGPLPRWRLLLQGLEFPLIAVVQWSTPKLPFTQSIYTHYR